MVDMTQTGKNRKWIALLSIVFSSAIIAIYLFQKFDEEKPSKTILITRDSHYFIPIKIQGFSSADIPYVLVEIEDKTIQAKLDSGFEGGVSLQPEFIKNLVAKTFIKNKSMYALSGKTYTKSLYEIPKISIGDMNFFPMQVEDRSEEFVKDATIKEDNESERNDPEGSIGWRIFQNFNLLIDCEHDIIAVCDSLTTLKERGYPTESFVEVPLLLDRGLIEFETMTEYGPLLCMLDTGSTKNLINKDLTTSDNSHLIFDQNNINEYCILNPENKNLLDISKIDETYKPSSFVIGKQEFPVIFNHIRSPMKIDAIIGMDFLNFKVVFIDFRNDKLYFYQCPEKEEECFCKKMQEKFFMSTSKHK